MTLTIRNAKSEDAFAIGKINTETWQTAYKGIVSQERLDSLDCFEAGQNWKKSIERVPETNSVILVAEMEGEVVGFAAGGDNRARGDNLEYSGELAAIYISSEFQHRGIGKKLVEQFKSALVKKNHDSMIIWVLKDNNPSRNFYRAIGGRFVAEKELLIGKQKLLAVSYGWKI